jgi:alpha-glucosidase
LLPIYTADRPEVHEVISGMRHVVDEFDDRVLIGEVYLPVDRLMAYYGRETNGLHLPFNFSLITANWHARAIAHLIDEYEAALPPGGWPNWVLGNHDRPRIATRIGSDQARVAAVLLLTLRGTPTIYYGEELGMQQVHIPPERVLDQFEKNVPDQGLGRDGARTPMQWDNSRFAGFSAVEPWLPLGSDYEHHNVAEESSDPGSSLRLYQQLIVLRQKHPALIYGSYHPVVAEGDLLIYRREWENERILVALNLGTEPTAVTFPSGTLDCELLVSTYGDREREAVHGSIDVRGNEGIVLLLASEFAEAKRT